LAERDWEDMKPHAYEDDGWIQPRCAHCPQPKDDPIHVAPVAEPQPSSYREQVERLTNLAEVSEAYRQAYQDGKYKLYAMGGAIAEAAVEHLPMSEGPLDRAARKILVEPHLSYLRKKVSELEAKVEALTAQLKQCQEGKK
jgi:hypothetical protein